MIPQTILDHVRKSSYWLSSPCMKMRPPNPWYAWLCLSVDSVFSGGLLQPPVRMMPQPQQVRRVEPSPRFPSRSDRPELILRKDGRRSALKTYTPPDSLSAYQKCENIECCRSLFAVHAHVLFACVCVVVKEREKEKEDDQESAHPCGNALENALLAENVLQDGHAKSSQDILCSSPNSLLTGKLRTHKCCRDVLFSIIWLLVGCCFFVVVLFYFLFCCLVTILL